VNVTNHLNYFLEHNEEVSKWVVGTAQGKKVSVPEHSQSSASVSASASVAKATAAATPTSIAASASGSKAEASQTSSAGNAGSTGAASAVSAGGYVVSLMVVVGTTLFSAALL
jgi:cytoskeletal protein RodZ